MINNDIEQKENKTISIQNFIILIDKGEDIEEWHDSGFRVSAANPVEALVAAHRFAPLRNSKCISVMAEQFVNE